MESNHERDIRWGFNVQAATLSIIKQTNKHKLRVLSPRANYADRATDACWRS
jgi:hypothetical protein